MIRIISVLVTEDNRQHAGSQDIGHTVCHLALAAWIGMIGEADDCDTKFLNKNRSVYHDRRPLQPSAVAIVTKVELLCGRCNVCGWRLRAEAPCGMQPGTSFGPGILLVLTYLHRSHHIGFERLSRVEAALFGLVISVAVVANMSVAGASL